MGEKSTPGPQVDGGERCPTACDRPSIVGSKGRKASAPSQTASHVEQVAMDSESEGAYVRAVMDNLPTLARSPVQKIGGRPQKGKVSGPYNHAVYGIHPQGDPVQSTRPKVTQKWTRGTVEPARGSLGDESRRPGRKPLAGRMPQEAKASGNAEDRLTWGRYERR